MGVKMYKSDSNLKYENENGLETEPTKQELSTPKVSSFNDNMGLGIGGNNIMDNPQTMDQVKQLTLQELEQILKEI